jgi:hypothetical protein
MSRHCSSFETDKLIKVAVASNAKAEVAGAVAQGSDLL